MKTWAQMSEQVDNALLESASVIVVLYWISVTEMSNFSYLYRIMSNTSQAFSKWKFLFHWSLYFINSNIGFNAGKISKYAMNKFLLVSSFILVKDCRLIVRIN